MRRFAVLGVLVAIAAGVTGFAFARGGSDPPHACQPVDEGVLPEWARASFSEREPRIAHVIGRHGRLAAILFGPLTSPPQKDVGNKILWESRVPQQAPSDLRLRATLVGSGETVTRTVAGGPGPSGIDLPHPGCWRIQAAWADQRDELELTYTAR
jgi:hypothetical protein